MKQFSSFPTTLPPLEKVQVKNACKATGQIKQPRAFNKAGTCLLLMIAERIGHFYLLSVLRGIWH